MPYNTPRQIIKGENVGRWKYTSQSLDNGDVWTHSCCTSCAGHETSDGAWEHYLEWSCNGIQRFTEEETRKKCIICQQWTEGIASIRRGMSMEYPVCPSHSEEETKEAVRRELFKKYAPEEIKGNETGTVQNLQR